MAIRIHFRWWSETLQLKTVYLHLNQTWYCHQISNITYISAVNNPDQEERCIFSNFKKSVLKLFNKALDCNRWGNGTKPIWGIFQSTERKYENHAFFCSDS